MAFYVTTPIYYVNAAPHLGHAYTTIGADILARHMRQRGEEVFFLTGTDEHGEPVAQAAEREGVTPQELADRNAAALPGPDAAPQRLQRLLHPHHRPAPRTSGVQEVLQRVYDNGHVYKGQYEGWYCPRCADFKTDAEIGAGQHLPDPPHPARLARARRTGSSASRPSRSSSSSSTPSQSDFVLAARALQRGALVHRRRPAGRLAQPRRSSTGACRCRGIPTTSSTSGSTRCSTTTRRSPSPATART